MAGSVGQQVDQQPAEGAVGPPIEDRRLHRHRGPVRHRPPTRRRSTSTCRVGSGTPPVTISPSGDAVGGAERQRTCSGMSIGVRTGSTGSGVFSCQRAADCVRSRSRRRGIAAGPTADAANNVRVNADFPRQSGDIAAATPPISRTFRNHLPSTNCRAGGMTLATLVLPMTAHWTPARASHSCRSSSRCATTPATSHDA